MRLRGIAASLFALAVAVIAPIAVAAPAQAGVNPHVITVQLDGSRQCVASTGGITGNPGSSFTVHNVDCATVLSYVIVQGTPGSFTTSGTQLVNGASATFTLGDTSGLMIIQTFVRPAPRVSVTVTTEVIPEPKPHDYFQQVGVPESGDCADVDPTVGHWFGYPIGGWSQSWAQWINDGAGGAVCTREIEERLDGTVVLIP